MLLLVFALGSMIVFFAREGALETYRCPHCAQIKVGTYHRLKCLLVHEYDEEPSSESAVFNFNSLHSHQHASAGGR